MAVRNRLKHWRHYFQYDKKKDFAQLCGLSETLYNRYENHRDEPGRDKLWVIWLNLRVLKPDLHMEELLEETPDK